MQELLLIRKSSGEGGWLSFEERLKFLVDERAESRAEFARRLGFKTGESVRQWEEGISKPSFEFLEGIASEFGVSLDWLVMGREQEFLPEEDADVGVATIERITETPGHESSWERVLVSTLTSSGVDVGSAKFLIARGPAMEPTIFDGDPLIVDATDQMADQVADGGVYAFRFEGQLLVKRLRYRHPTVFARSDNRSIYPDEEVFETDSICIIGRVRWVGRRL